MYTWETTESSAPRRERDAALTARRERDAALTGASKGAIAAKAPNSALSKARARSPIREESDEAIREVLSFLSQVSLSLSLSHTHTHTHSRARALSLSLARALPLSLSLSLARSLSLSLSLALSLTLSFSLRTDVVGKCVLVLLYRTLNETLFRLGSWL